MQRMFANKPLASTDKPDELSVLLKRLSSAADKQNLIPLEKIILTKFREKLSEPSINKAVAIKFCGSLLRNMTMITDVATGFEEEIKNQINIQIKPTSVTQDNTVSKVIEEARDQAATQYVDGLIETTFAKFRANMSIKYK